MLTKIWDWLFRRYTYELINETPIYCSQSNEIPCGRMYIMKRDDGMIVVKKTYG